ncbi:hypothetical protein, partial [Poseidonibacter lekithochrous]|uniref:hypothetical protein n=1 Tax=Poseidonibacter lekithochrous TaxID=1904463 RepID=UPI000A915C87
LERKRGVRGRYIDQKNLKEAMIVGETENRKEKVLLEGDRTGKEKKKEGEGRGGREGRGEGEEAEETMREKRRERLRTSLAFIVF